MTSSDKIAIVVPAYKADFLKAALSSIAAQTCRDFSVYVGDDCSEQDLKAIVDEFSSAMDIHYVRFGTNLGGQDLVAQWERCIRLAGDEKWILLFSDDDLMPADAVERFQEASRIHPDASFFRFPLQIIDERDSVVAQVRPLVSDRSSAEEYLLDYFGGVRPSSTCEYVFSKALFEEVGMVHFPCAWCSDIATWYSYAAKAGGMVNVPGSPSSWRNAAEVNISSTKGLYDRKMDALIQFVSFLKTHYRGAFDRKFKKKLALYIKTILEVSLDLHFTQTGLEKLARALFPISPLGALELYLKYFPATHKI